MMDLSPETVRELHEIAAEGGKDAVFANALLAAAENGEGGE